MFYSYAALNSQRSICATNLKFIKIKWLRLCTQLKMQRRVFEVAYIKWK